MKIYDVQQGSVEWHDLRKGVPTASNFKRIMTPKGRSLSSQADRYIDQLLGEKGAIHYPARAENYMSRAVQWGIETENEARRWFHLETGLEIIKAGFITTDDGRFGCSPDGLVMGDAGTIVGGIEIKCPEPAAHMRWRRELASGKLPTDHLCQIHGCLVVTGLPSWHWVSYCPGLDPINVRVVPDQFTEDLRSCLELFWLRLLEIKNSLEKPVAF